MTIDLNEHDAHVLLAALNSYVADLRTEIAATERKEYRDDLKLREETLRRIVAQLQS